MKGRFLIPAFFILQLFCQQGFSQKIFVLTDTLLQASVSHSYLGIYIDSTCQKEIREISNPDFRNNFTYISDNLPVNRNTEAAYWLHFKISNRSSARKKWVLEFFDHNINHVSLFEKGPLPGFIELKSGNRNNFFERKIHHKNLIFEILVPGPQPVEYYVRIKSSNLNVIKPEIRSFPVFINYALYEYYYLGIFYGILAIMALYNFLLYIMIKRVFYLYYACYVVSVFLFTMCQNGLAFAIIWPECPGMNDFSNPVFFYLSTLFLVFFAKDYLNITYKIPVWDRMIKLAVALRGGILILGLLLFPDAGSFIILDLFPLTITYAAIWSCLKKGDTIFMYFIFPYTLVYITFLITILEQYGLVPSGVLTVYSFNIGIVLEIILLSLSLAGQMRNEIKIREKTQKLLLEEITEKEFLTQKVNRELEEKVKERTEELDRVNEKLMKQVEDTNVINQKLDLLNFSLKQNVNEIAQKRIGKRMATFEEFLEVFPNEQACLRYLARLKSEMPFFCKNCSSSTCGKGKEIFDRRCTKCGYNESVTGNTLFHKVKFPLLKAFYITHVLFTRKDTTVIILSEMLDLRKETCSAFKRKVLERLNLPEKKDTENWDSILIDERTAI